MLFYSDKRIIYCTAIGEMHQKNFLFLLNEKRYPALNFHHFKTFYSSEVLVIACSNDRIYNMHCIVPGLTYWPRVPISTFHMCMKSNAAIDGKCKVCNKFAIEWPKYELKILKYFPLE